MSSRMSKAIRLADVAREAGVSHGTASNVFSRPDIVRDEVRKRVRAAAERLGYAGPDPKGRLLRAGKVNAIGVAMAEPLSYFFDDPFAKVVMSGISQVCDATGAGISLKGWRSTKRFRQCRTWIVTTPLRSAVLPGGLTPLPSTPACARTCSRSTTT